MSPVHHCAVRGTLCFRVANPFAFIVGFQVLILEFASNVFVLPVSRSCVSCRFSLHFPSCFPVLANNHPCVFNPSFFCFQRNPVAFSAECLSIFCRMSQRFQRNVLRFREKSFGIVGDECGDFLKMAGIGGVECRKVGTVDVEHANDFTFFPQGNHDFAP